MKIFPLDRNAFRALGALIPTLLLSACGGGGGDGSGGSASQGMGSVRVALTDAPACGFDAVNVTIREVRIHRSSEEEDRDDEDDNDDDNHRGKDGEDDHDDHDDNHNGKDKDKNNHNDGWTRISIDPPRKINLLDLTNGVFTSLGEAPLEAGHYQQVRLVLASNNGGNIANSVVFSGTGVEIPISLPSGDRSGIKLVHGFTVNAGQRTDLMLDFDACKSIVRHGKDSRFLKPKIKLTAVPVPVETAANGIRGVVNPALLGSNVMVSAQQGGEIILSAAPDSQTGEFFLARLAPGTYDFVMTADGYSTAVIINVPVADQNAVAVLATSAQPLTLPASGTRTITGTVRLNPASTTNTVPFVTAKQSGNATTISVKTDAADLLDGTYLLTLPIEAPVSGRYGPLPIPVNPFPAAGGRYNVEASAEGYATSPPVAKEIVSGSASQNFTLVP